VQSQQPGNLVVGNLVHPLCSNLGAESLTMEGNQGSAVESRLFNIGYSSYLSKCSPPVVNLSKCRSLVEER
jgi:hypothetical protein